MLPWWDKITEKCIFLIYLDLTNSMKELYEVYWHFLQSFFISFFVCIIFHPAGILPAHEVHIFINCKISFISQQGLSQNDYSLTLLS